MNDEYKILHEPPNGLLLLPWASQSVKDAVGPGSFERKLNKFTDAGWEIVSFHTAPEGGFFWARVMATVLLRRSQTTRTDTPVA